MRVCVHEYLHVLTIKHHINYLSTLVTFVSIPIYVQLVSKICYGII